MRALLVLLVACGGKSTPVEKPLPPAEAPLDPACPAQATIDLPDGKLRCRELPFTLDFPPNTKLRRNDENNLTFMAADIPRGALALFVEPRFDITGDDATGLRSRLELVVTNIAKDAVITDAVAPPQEGATLSAAIQFTTPDGGIGLAHAYLAHNWFVAVFAGGRKPDTETRPDQPVGKAFLASLKLRPFTPKWVTHDVLNMKLELPAAAWEGAPVKPEPGTADVPTKLWSVATERVWIGARDLAQADDCTKFKISDAEVPAAMKSLFGREDLEVTGGTYAKIADGALFAEVGTPGGTMALYLICTKARVLMVTVTGKRSNAELKTLLDRVTSHFKR